MRDFKFQDTVTNKTYVFMANDINKAIDNLIYTINLRHKCEKKVKKLTYGLLINDRYYIGQQN